MSKISKAIEIRVATEDDVPEIRKAIRSSIEGLASRDYSEDVIQSWGADTPRAKEKQRLAIRAKMELTWVAVLNDKIVGFSAFSPQTQELRAVYVAAEVARLGIGTKLLECVEGKARELGLSSLKMHSSITAAPFYRHHGYSVIGEVVHTLTTGAKMIAVEMRKEIGGQSLMESDLIVESATDKQAVMAFLERYEETAQFLVNNLREHGLSVTDDPYSGNFKVIKRSSEIVAVFYVARCGNVYAQATSPEFSDLILETCEKEPFPIKGFLGSWDLLNSCYERFVEKNPGFKPSYFSKEILYGLALTSTHRSLQHHPKVRILTRADFKEWFPLRSAYTQELHLPFDMTEEQVKARFLQATENQAWWGYFESGHLVSIAGLNSRSDTIGQIGGVFTPKELRQQGLSKATMLHMLRDCRDLHGLKKSILFTGETDIPAQKLYESIGLLTDFIQAPSFNRAMNIVVNSILLLYFSFGATAYAAGNCVQFWSSKTLAQQIELHSMTQGFSGAWDSYFSFSETVAFTDLQTAPNCILVIINGNPIKVETTSPIVMPNGIYHFYLRGTAEFEVPVELEQLFAANSIRYASIYSLSDFPFPPDFKDYDQYLTGFNEIQFVMSLHESFHFNVQFLSKSGDSAYPWPQWNIQPDLDELNQNCYNNSALNISAKNELDLLIKAFKLAVIYQKPVLAKSALSDYVSTKKERYKSLHDVRIKSPEAGVLMTCQEAEENQELIEGSAEYYGLAGALHVGIISPLQIIDLSEMRWTWKMPYGSEAVLLSVYNPDEPSGLRELTGTHHELTFQAWDVWSDPVMVTCRVAIRMD